MEVPAILLPKIFNHPFTYVNNTKKIKKIRARRYSNCSFWQKKEVGVIWDKIRNT